MMKRTIGAILALVMCMSLCAPAFATEIIESEDEVKLQTADFYGYTFTEMQLANGDYVICSFYEGQPQKCYTIPKNGGDILVEYVGRSETSGNYTIERPQIVWHEVEPLSAEAVAANRWAYLGWINYEDHPLAGTVRGQVSCNGTTRRAADDIDEPKNTLLDDMVASVAAFLVDAGVVKIIEIYGGRVNAAGALVISLLSEHGVNVVSGKIDRAVSDTVETYITDWDFKVSPFIEGVSGTSVYLYEMGVSELILYNDTNEWETEDDDVTRSTWTEKPSFARAAWEEMYPDYTYPGVDSYTAN